MEIDNLYVLVSHVLVPPAMEVILGSPDNQVQGFLAAGHVCTVVGYEEYIPIANKYKVPIVVTGFELNDVLIGVLRAVKMLGAGDIGVINEYEKVVNIGGNKTAQGFVYEVFEVAINQSGRGIGVIPHSGLQLREEYKQFDAELRFSIDGIVTRENTDCIAAQVLMGIKKPHDCPLYGFCSPDNPVGSPMVSDEGACAAYYHVDGGEK